VRVLRRGSFAWLVFPLAALAWPLVATQQGSNSQQGGKEDEETADQELAPLVSELSGTPQKFAATYGIGERPESAPVLVPMRDGGAWLVALEWEPGAGDHILVRPLLPSGTTLKKSDGHDASPALVVDPAPHEILRPVAIEDAKGRLVVAWTETTDAGPVLKAARLEGERFTAPATLTEPSQFARNLELALDERTPGGGLWCCFEGRTPPAAGSDKGGVDVLLAPIEQGDGGMTLGTAVCIGDGRFTDSDPVVASSEGKLCVAWSQYRGRDYEIMLRSYDPKSGTLGAPLNVSADSESDDLHPSLVSGANGELWLGWDRLIDPLRGSSMPRSLRDPLLEPACGVHVMSAIVRGGKVLLPEGRRGLPPGVVVGVPQFSWTGGMPTLAVDPQGRPWLAYRFLTYGGPSGERYGYATVAHHWNGAGWSAPVTFDRTIGPMEQPALCAVGGGALVAWQKDRRFELVNQEAAGHLPASLKKALDAAHFESRGWTGEAPIVVAALPESVPTGGAAEGAKLVERVERLANPHYHPAADPIDDPYVNGSRHFTVERGNQKWTVYWGDLHRHSCVSRCSRGMEERPHQRSHYGRDVHLYDFMALTDHSGQIDPVSWWLEDKLVRLERSPDFCALAGYEWSSIPYGHQNVILAGRLDPVVMVFCKPDELYRKLSAADAIAIPHGTADQGRSAEIGGWDDRMVRLVEVYQAMRGNSEFDGCVRQSKRARVDDCFVQDALNDGHQFGLIASTDHGNGCSYAVALAERLDVASLMEAFRARRTYAATTKGMLVDFRIGDHVMGEACECAEAPKLHVKVHGAAELAELVVFRDGAPVFALGRDLKPAGGAAREDATVDVALRLELTQQAKEGDEWRLTLKAPGCELERNGSSAGLHRYHRNPPYPRWRTNDDVATFVWPESFTPDEVDHLYRLDLHGTLGTKLELQWDGQRREVPLAALIRNPIEGTTERGWFKITASEPPDSVVDLDKGLGARDLEQEFVDEKLAAGKHWYYVRAIQKDGEIVWSSPIFVTRK
jgi:hypothetical protein